MKARLRKIVGSSKWILLLIAYFVGSEIYYARSISPNGISTVREFFNRFGEPQSIHVIHRDGQRYYEFTGHLPSKFILATPSDPPAYVFDDQGRLTAWCSDPGDIPSFRQTWPLDSTNQITIGAARKVFGL